jgi:hypothetical protein
VFHYEILNIESVAPIGGKVITKFEAVLVIVLPKLKTQTARLPFVEL